MSRVKTRIAFVRRDEQCFKKKSECSFHTRGDSKKLFMLMYINENMKDINTHIFKKMRLTHCTVEEYKFIKEGPC